MNLELSEHDLSEIEIALSERMRRLEDAIKWYKDANAGDDHAPAIRMSQSKLSKLHDLLARVEQQSKVALRSREDKA